MAPLCGFHSGWHDGGDPTEDLRLSFRRRVTLRPFPAKLVGASGPESPPFGLKTSSPGSGVGAISSGAGSAVFEWRGGLYRLKRCGFKDQGLGGPPIADRAFFRDAEGTLREVSVETPRGLCAPELIDSELRALHAARREGLVRDMTVAARYQVGEAGASVLFAITSDVRADEFYLHARDLGLRGLALTVFHDVGALYATAHRAGFTRGVGNAWFGNDVVLPDGNISFVDVENAFVPTDLSPPLLEFVQTCDLLQYRSALVVAFSSESTLRESAGAAIGAFQNGYQKRHESGAAGERAGLLRSTSFAGLRSER